MLPWHSLPAVGGGDRWPQLAVIDLVLCYGYGMTHAMPSILLEIINLEIMARPQTGRSKLDA